MKIALIGPEIEESLSMRYLAAALVAAGHRCRILAFDGPEDSQAVARRILASRPSLVGLSLVAQRRYVEFQELVRSLRRHGSTGHITAGGHFAGLRAPEVLRDTPGLDTILHHEGEERIVKLAAWLESAVPSSTDPCPVVTGRKAGGGSAPGHARAFPDLPQDLDGISWRDRACSVQHRAPKRVLDVDALQAPMRRRPDRTLRTPRAPLISSRGCSGSCTFCSIHAWHRQVPGARLRFRSPEAVAQEMIALHRAHRVRVFIFHDDDFIHPDPSEAKRRCRATLDRAARGIGEAFAFVIKCRPDHVDADLFRDLGARGLVRAYVGVESASATGLRTLNRRVDPGTNERALATLRELGIFSCFNLLLFHPETTLEELDDSLGFLERHAMHPFDVARTELYARSTLEQRMLREGRALGDYRGYDYRVADAGAEAVFRLFEELLWERHFGAHSIVHRMQDLGFRASLLRRLHPQAHSADVQARVEALIREVNADTVRYLRFFTCLVRGEATEWATAGAAWRDGFRREVRARGRDQSLHCKALSLELECRAALGRAGLAGRPAALEWPRWIGRAAAMPAAAVLLSGLSCGDGPTVCDPPPPPPARFSTDIEPELDQTCAVSGCHTQPAPAAGLDLRSGSSYDQLVGVPSTELPSMPRVEPGRPDSSYVVHKLQGTQTQVGGSGERMPKGGELLPGLVYRMTDWIRRGAKRD